jgi:deoxyribonuclease V
MLPRRSRLSNRSVKREPLLLSWVVSLMTWPATREQLLAAQLELGRAAAEEWDAPTDRALLCAGCFVCHTRGKVGPGARGDRCWAAAALTRRRSLVTTVVVEGEAAAPYEPGLLALREGPLLEAALRALPERPELLVADATGRDHPRRAGLAFQLGAMLDLPSVGVTSRPLVAYGEPPLSQERGARAPLKLDGEVVGHWVVTRPGARPVAVSAGWRVDPDVAADLVLRLVRRARTPEPLRRARMAARDARAAADAAPRA